MVQSAPHRRTLRTLSTVSAIAVILLGFSIVSPVSAAPTLSRCEQTVVLIHDTARGSDSMSQVKSLLEQHGWCPPTIEYGATAVTGQLEALIPQTVAGLASLTSGAAEFGSVLASIPGDGPITVIGHGAGSLIAQYYLQHHRDLTSGSDTGSITRIITIGPIWRGTDALFLGTTEELSRQLGTYDAVLQLERPIVDPLCAGCRDLIAGSDFLRAMHAAEFPTPGVEYRNIISPTDTLVEPATSAAIPGMDNKVLQRNPIGTTPDHFAMVTDPIVLDHVVSALVAT